MNGGSAGLRRWTQRFTVASAASFVLFLVAVSEADRRVAVTIGLFGFVCPMIFGMAYLLLPPYVGTTLVDQRLAGVHFVLAYTGVGLLVSSRLAGGTDTPFLVGVLSWTLGVFVFLGSIVATVGSAVRERPSTLLRGGDRPQRSTKLATMMIPVALGYLLVGTLGLLATAGVLDGFETTLAQVVHFYAIGFGALLVFALGARLLIGFFRVQLPKPLVWIVLGAGALAPTALGAFLWVDPWFRIGAILATIAMVGYLLLVAFVAWRTDRVRVGCSGILFGAVAGVGAVGTALRIAFGTAATTAIPVHRLLVLGGFFPLTIVGYAYLFFPVTESSALGASARTARSTIALLTVGVAAQAGGILVQFAFLRSVGTLASVVGAIGYTALLVRRFE